MEEKKTIKPHGISWKGRTSGEITGVTDVLSFDENSVILETEQGMLTVKGKNLHIDRLMLEQGVVEMEGTVDSMVYSGSNRVRKENLIKRMFR